MRILVVGGSGFLGSRLAATLDGSCQSTYHQRKVLTNQIQMDLGDGESIKQCLAQAEPEVVLHCGGLTGTDFCEANPDLANRVNFSGTEVLLNEFDGKIIYFSTDYVFDGENAPYDENSEPNPINHYGKTKLLAERKVLEKPQNLVVRVSGLYGVNKHNNRFIDCLRKNGVIRASKNLISTPTYIGDIARALPELMPLSGLVHFSGQQSFSRYEFLKKAVEALGLNAEVVSEENSGIARRPRNSSLASFYGLNKIPMDEALKEMREVI